MASSTTTGPDWPEIEREWRKLLAESSRPATELEVENRELRASVADYETRMKDIRAVIAGP
jgi:hypothetical protein